MNHYNPQIISPSHSQWGVLNNLKQQEYEQALKLQKILDHQKKENLRSELQKQLQAKDNNLNFQKIQDKFYYDFIVKKTNEEQSKEKQQKLQKYFIRKSMDLQNRNKQIQSKQTLKNSRHRFQHSQSKQQYLIGYRDDTAKKIQQNFKKQLVSKTLEEQLKEKQINKKIQRTKQIEDFYKNLQYQENLEKSQLNKKNKFQQNDQVYHYYSSIFKKKEQQQNKLEYSLVNKPNLLNKQSEQELKRRKVTEQQLKKQKIKDALDHQVDEQHNQRIQEKQPKPQDISYSCFGNMFNENSKGYGRHDKKEYSKYLQKQILQQKNNKKIFQFMNHREYLYNLNQINKALNGTYLKQSYQDNSITNVGESFKLSSKELKGISDKFKKQHSQNPEIYELTQDQIRIRNNLKQLLKKNSFQNNSLPSLQKSNNQSNKDYHKNAPFD